MKSTLHLQYCTRMSVCVYMCVQKQQSRAEFDAVLKKQQRVALPAGDVDDNTLGVMTRRLLFFYNSQLDSQRLVFSFFSLMTSVHSEYLCGSVWVCGYNNRDVFAYKPKVTTCKLWFSDVCTFILSQHTHTHTHRFKF